MKKICLLFKYGRNIGLGHLKRCLMLKGQLSDISEVSLISSGVSDLITLNERDVSFCKTESEIVNNIRNIKPDLVICDRQQNDEGTIKTLSEDGTRIILIEDNGPALDLADFVFDANRQPDECRDHFFGPDWSFIDPGILRFRKKSVHTEVKKIFVCMGGTDVNKNIPYIISTLSPYYELIVLPGIHYKEYLNYNSPGVKILSSDTPFYKEAAHCDIALISGGVVMHEMCALNLPSVVWPQVEHQKRNAGLLLRKGYIFYTDGDNFLKAVREVADDYPKRDSMLKRLSRRDPVKALKKVKKIVEGTYG